MATKRQLVYEIGFTADTKEFVAKIDQAMKSLQKVVNFRLGENFTSDAKEAALAAQELQRHLTNAVNVDTGKIDLSKFQASLKSGNLSLEDYANKLQSIGPTGEKAFLDLASAIAKAELPIKRTSKLFDNLWITMKNTMRWQLTSSMLHNFVGALQGAYGYTKDLNESLNNIRIVTGKSAEDMGKFAEQANKAAQILSTTTTDYTNASLIYYQQGLNDQEVQERTDATIKFANVSRQNAETASEQLTSIWNNFDDGSKSLEYYIDVMVRLGAETASSSEEISQGVQKFAATADTIGLSYEYAASALATVTATTRQSADVVGTAFKTLFARIQGLSLGETLDDGTTLTKYSQALEKVGISIFDQNNQLKDMDILLDEMGNKWDTLAKDQQVALAQTVAGVRQYTQLIALMDNWDFFQENLASAYDAEGTLNQQAEIYAESWEAARDRVSAAAENIYDSLINEDFFIGFDNNLADFLNGIASGVDALGGMSGAINLLGLALTSAFGDKIAQSLRDLTYNFTIMTGAAEKAQRQLKEEMGNRALTMVTDSAALSSDINIVQAQIQAEDIQMQNQLNVVAKQLTEEQYKQLAGYKDIITQIKTMALEYNQVVAQQKESNEEIIQSIMNLDNVSKSSKNYSNGLREAGNKLQQIPELLKLITNNNGTYSKSLNSLIQGYSKLGTVGSQLSTIRSQFQAIDEEVIDNQTHIQTLSERFQQLSGVQLRGNYLEQLVQMEKIVNQVNGAIEQLYNSLRASGIDTTILDNFATSVNNIGINMAQSSNATSIAAEETKKYMLAMYEATNKQKDWASLLVAGANELMRIGMMIQAVKNLGSIWDDEDLTTGEKVVQTLTSFGMIIPTVTSLIKLATSAKTKYNAVTIVGTAAEEADILAKNAQTIAVGKHAKARIVETKVVDGNTVAVVANTTAWYANPIFWIGAILVGVIAAFAAYTSHIEENTKRQRENAVAAAEAAQAQAEASKQERENVDSLYKEYIELRNSLDNSAEGKEALKSKTKELCEALGVEWSALDELSNKYDEVNKKIAEANKETVIDAIRNTNNAIQRTRSAMLEEGSEYDSYLANQEGYEDLSYQVDFKGGANGADESEIKDYFDKVLSNSGFGGIITTGANQGFQFSMEGVEDFFIAYEALAKAVEDIQTNEAFEGIRIDSEVFQAAKDWVAEYAEDYGKIAEYQKDLVGYAQQLAEAEAAIAGYDLANVNSISEYNKVKVQYINNLKNAFENYELLTPEMDDTYFENLAEQYLAGYSHMVDIILASNALEEILAIIGESNREKIEQYFNNDNYNIKILANLDWEVISNSDDLDTAIENAYEAEEARRNVLEFKTSIVETSSIISTLLEENELSEEQIKLLDTLEQKYGDLAAIRDRRSAQYIQALRDIREGMEHSLSTDAINKLNDAWDNLDSLTSTNIVGSYEKLRAIFGDEIDLRINLDSDDAMRQLKEIMDADYAVQLAIEADLQSDIDDFLDYSTDIQTALGYIEEGFTVSAENARMLQKVFPGILSGYTDLANGMIQLDREIAQQHINKAETQIAAEKEACKQNILDYQKVLLSKAAAMRTIAEGLWELSQSDSEASEEAAKAKAKIENGVTQLKDACADEQALISEGLATSEIDDSNQVLTANENAAGTSANNWANAYNSMAINSSEWARIAISNANKVGEALRNAANGGPAVSTEVATGGIFSHYSGGFEEAEYSSAYESANAEEKSWEDYYQAGDFDAAHDAAIKQAEAYESAASELAGYLAELDGHSGKISNLVNNIGSGSKGGGGGDNEGTKYDPEEGKSLEDIEERYHEITRAIQRQEDALEDLDNQIDRTYGLGRLDLYKESIEELNEQANNQLKKMREAESYLAVDQAEINRLFDGAAIYNANGEIANYSALLRQTVDEYNNGFLADYNAFLMEFSALTKEEQEARKAEYESWQVAKEEAEARYQSQQDALKQYEETLDVIQEMKDAYEDSMRAIEDQKLAAVTYKLEVILDVKNVKDAAKEFSKAIVESFGDELNHGLGSAAISYEQAQLEAGLLPSYLEQYQELKNLMANANQFTDTSAIVDAMEELQSSVISSGEALLEWIETVETMLPDAIDAAADRFSLFTDQLDHNSSVLDTIKELLSLQGVTYKTMEGFASLQKVTREQMDAATASAELNRKWYEESREALMRAEAALVGVSETDVAYDTLKNNRDALLAQFNESQEAMFSSAQEAMEAAQEMYLAAVEKAVYDFGQAVSNGIGLDLLQQKYDHYIESEERYLDKVNEAYQVSAWYNKLQKDIDDTANAMYKDRLLALQEEIDLRRDGNTLSEYDLEILEAKYQVLQAQMALEDAQNAKNQLNLVRDSQGNWNYQYSADPGAIADAEGQLLSAENDWYNIAKGQVQDVTGEIINTWTECQDAIEEIYSDMTLTDQERADRAAEIYEYYTEKIKFLENEKQISVQDMTEAGNKALIDNAIITGDEITDLTGITTAEIEKIIADSGKSIIDLLLADNGQIAEIVGGSTELIDLFENKFAEDLGKMTDTTANFEEYFRQATDNMSQAFEEYGNNVADIADYAGVTLEDLADKTDVLSDSTDRCRDAGLDAAQAMWESIDAIQSASMYYIDLANSIMEAVYALEELAHAQAMDIESYSNMDAGWGDIPTGDYSGWGDIGSSQPGWGEAPVMDTPTSSVGGSYVVQKGDNLWDISKELYGSGSSWETLYEKNKAMIDAQAEASGLTKRNDANGWWIFPGQVLSFRTGGYTGEFSGAKVGLFHEKELILNKSDTENILTAVSAIRSISPDTFANIEKLLDNNALAGSALMAQKLGATGVAVSRDDDVLEQHVTIERVEFPNVTSANEINEAFATIVNDAAQWAKRRKD